MLPSTHKITKRKVIKKVAPLPLEIEHSKRESSKKINFNNLEIADFRNQNLSMLNPSDNEVDIVESIENARQKMKAQEPRKRVKLQPLNMTAQPKSLDKERLILAMNDDEMDTDFSYEHDRGLNTTMNIQRIQGNPYSAESIKGRRKTLKPIERTMNTY